MSKRTTAPDLTPRIRTGPKLRPRYCTFCGVKCEGAREARGHCKDRGTGKGEGTVLPFTGKKKK